MNILLNHLERQLTVQVIRRVDSDQKQGLEKLSMIVLLTQPHIDRFFDLPEQIFVFHLIETQKNFRQVFGIIDVNEFVQLMVESYV